MSPKTFGTRFAAFAAVLVLAACHDASVPLAPADEAQLNRSPHGPQDMRAWFAQSAPDVMALPQTVFASHDAEANQLVFGVETHGAGRAVQAVVARQGMPASAYRIELTAPIHFMSTTLRTEHRPTKGGIQIHFSSWLCTLGFNVNTGSNGSFITNSHCTDVQGQNTGTLYYQPTSTAAPNAIATEAADPAYFTGGPCSSGRRCRYSDAARAAYHSGTASTQGAVAKTTGVNNGSVTVDGSFWITEQNNTATSYSGTVEKVGRTTGWSSGNVTNTCATVNVSGSDIQLLCQTLVQRRGKQIVGGGDSGSQVFQVISGDNVRLIGILWGGSMNGDTFVFSPLKSILDELGAFTATLSGNPPEGDPPPDDDSGPNCPPNSNNPRCR